MKVVTQFTEDPNPLLPPLEGVDAQFTGKNAISLATVQLHPPHFLTRVSPSIPRRV